MPGTEDPIERRIESALCYRRDTDDLVAELKYAVGLAENRYKATVDAYFLAHEGPVEQRKAMARTEAEPEYLALLEAIRKHDAVKNKRDTAELEIEVGRSQMSDRRHGII